LTSCRCLVRFFQCRFSDEQARPVTLRASRSLALVPHDLYTIHCIWVSAENVRPKRLPLFFLFFFPPTRVQDLTTHTVQSTITFDLISRKSRESLQSKVLGAHMV
jgi:hypothetical protein